MTIHKTQMNNYETNVKERSATFKMRDINITTTITILDADSLPLPVTVISVLAGICLVPLIILVAMHWYRRQKVGAIKTEYFIYHKPIKLPEPIAFTIPKTSSSKKVSPYSMTQTPFRCGGSPFVTGISGSSEDSSPGCETPGFQRTSTPTSDKDQSSPVRYGLDPAVYQIKTPDEDQSKIPSKYCLGKLQFSVSYAPMESQLTFLLLQVIQLPATNMRGTTDSYVQVNLIPNTQRLTYRSRMKRDTLSPQFRQYFTFVVPVSAVQAMAVKFVVFQCDEDNNHANPLGEILYPLRTFDPNSSEKFEPIWIDIHQDESLRDYRQGELFLSLTYLPNASRLNVVILRAKNLQLRHHEVKSCQCNPRPRSFNKGKCGLYVKLSMVKERKCYKNRQTSVKSCHQHPVFNQAFSMDLKASELEHAYIVLAVCHSLRAHGVVGRTVIGPFVYSTGDGAEHWNDMLEAPRSAVPHWHTLF